MILVVHGVGRTVHAVGSVVITAVELSLVARTVPFEEVVPSQAPRYPVMRGFNIEFEGDIEVRGIQIVSGRLNVNRFGHLKVNIRTCKSEQKSEHFSRVRTARSVAIKGHRPSALRAFTPPLAAVEARGAGEPGPFELRLCGPFPCRKVVAA